MYEPVTEFEVKASAAYQANNLAVYNHKLKGFTYAAYCGVGVVQIVGWDDATMEQQLCETVLLTDLLAKSGVRNAAHSRLMQVHICLPVNRMSCVPVLTVLTTTTVFVVDVKTRKLLFSAPVADAIAPGGGGGGRWSAKACSFVRGLSSVENLILVGTQSGQVLLVSCGADTSFHTKKNTKEHDVP